ncbi:MAG TPA: hypothetical protein VGI83_05080 [Gemmatimonadales bacterium]|jgi:hypothetical protein
MTDQEPTPEERERAERENPDEHIAYHEAMGERYYSLMYDASSSTRASGYYSDAKAEFAEATRIATQAGRTDARQRLAARIEHIKAVFRSQFR